MNEFDVDIDYQNLHFIKGFEYDIFPDKEGNMVLIFKVNDISCALPIHKRDLKRLLNYAESKIT
jgi:hypothetical protein